MLDRSMVLKLGSAWKVFFCLVRNTTMYHIRPQWYFTSEALENYMKLATKKWTTHDVGTKVEAFSIAGCDALSKFVPR